MEIEKNVPLKEDLMKKKKYPFKDMGIGDSFLIKCETPDRDKTKKRLVSSAHQFYNKNKGFKFKISRVEDGVRVWRV